MTEREIQCEADARRRLVAVARDLHRSALVGGPAGNLSVRLDAGRLLVTPSGVNKGHLAADDLVLVELEAGEPAGRVADSGTRREGRRSVRRATSELPFHRAVYRARPDVSAVVHTHAPALTAAGLRKIDICAPFPEIRKALGSVRRVPFLPSGSRELARAVAEAATGADVLVLVRHGVVALGATPEEARDRTELAELTAWAAILARDAGIGIDLGRVAALHRRLAARSEGPDRR